MFIFGLHQDKNKLQMNAFYGAGVALITPFNNDLSIDFDGLERIIDYQIVKNIDYLVSLGTTGETATLTLDEKIKIWKFTAEKVANRVPLVAGIGGNNTAEVLHEMESLETLGYSAILSVSPYYNKPSQEGIYQHYKSLSEHSSLPIILYNIPGRTGSNMSVETILRLAYDFKNIIGVKEASGNFDQFNRIMQGKPDDFLLISGDDPVTLPMMALGAAGIISVVGNAFPSEVKTLTSLCLAQNYKVARDIHNQLLQITDLCFVDGNPAGIKAILAEMDLVNDNVRLPLVSVSDKTRSSIKEELKKHFS